MASDSAQVSADSPELQARVFQKLGQPDQAITAYRQALSYDPNAMDWRVSLVKRTRLCGAGALPEKLR